MWASAHLRLPTKSPSFWRGLFLCNGIAIARQVFYLSRAPFFHFVPARICATLMRILNRQAFVDTVRTNKNTVFKRSRGYDAQGDSNTHRLIPAN